MIRTGILRHEGPGRLLAVAVWLGGAALLALASCAPLSPPVPASPAAPPAEGEIPTPPVTTPAPPAPFRLDREPEFDIGLAVDLERATVLALPAAQVVVRSSETVRTERNVGGAITLDLADGRARATWRVTDGAAVSVTAAPAETLWIEPSGSARIGWNEKTWRGSFKVFVSPRGRLTIATRVPLETYLIGVVPGEIGALSATLLEAGKAQAIAARSYSLFYRGRRGAEGFDLYGTVEDQVYGPFEGERELATRCVTSTHGALALYDGAPIRANYCSTCGGITADVWEGWPTPAIPYLVSHRDSKGAQDYCAASPHYRWREEWPAADFLAGVMAQADAEAIARPARAGDLVDARVRSRSRSGRVWSLEVRTTTGTVTIPAHRLRWMLRRPGNGRGILRSNLIKIDVRRDPATRRALAVIASGAGSGHGVGLCQTGALGMARDRATADQILMHYYPGTEIRKLY